MNRIHLKNYLKSIPKTIWAVLIFVFFVGWFFGHAGRRPAQPTENTTEQTADDVAWWTCSMHPQIKLPEPGQCPICYMDLIPLESAGTDETVRELKLSEAAVKLAEITTTAVRRGQPAAEVRMSGKIVPDERNEKTITAWVPGRIEKLFVDFTGTTVQNGDPLVALYSPALYSAQEELLQALKQKDSSSFSEESADMFVNAVREKLSQLGLTDRQIAEVETRGTATDRLTIVSPISGVVTHKNALQGMYVDKGSQIYKIVDLSDVWAVIDAYEKDIGFLKTGQKVTFTAEALPGSTFDLKITFINPFLDEKTRAVKVRLDVNNPNGLLKPGMFIRAVVNGSLPGSDKNPLLIPASAVLKTGKRAVVYVRKPDTEAPVFEGREVILGPRAGDFYVVVSGLSEGELVVTKGNFKIDSAFQIQAKPSMMSPESGAPVTGGKTRGAAGSHGQSDAHAPMR